MKTKVLHDGLDGHVQRSLERAEQRDAGKWLEAEKIFTFADLLDQATPQNRGAHFSLAQLYKTASRTT